ncbi:MAG: NADH-quinone oxidoreductase subunit NuoE [Candidatus Dadabacteria bacterium]|nr:NADH-quinone oxidoreductase subunit NuoE [Candidatus Dadabacteria bacterium]NIS07740.1 NADH-quinone oxidoreductase subunit NuoE [Candidatus Dadabacteria bacterium]NIV42345.1 NADH-quinone oxidoreductase subunit NuoE [Candidatus Dadabacteria bacterium]NIY21381.1 NADH-quinone oxidoreductase subunit NuoE [Candidatus Dadabacteria bacterium]
MPFSSELKAKITEKINSLETKQSALIPVLHTVQYELGHISNESMEEVAAILELSPSCVQNVVTFYTMYFNEPKGKHVIWLCRTLSCALKGAEHVEHYIGDKLNVKTGETTADGKITFMEAECLAACGAAPVMLVDEQLHENLTKSKVDSIIEDLQKG